MSHPQVTGRGGASHAHSRMGATKQQRASAPPPNASKSSRPSLSRRSINMSGKVSQNQPETRPINERGFQQECIRTLVSYLTSHGYNLVVSQKTLQTPSSKDVTSIVHFLFLQIDPNWEFKKIEEDVPLVFKRLGYPVQISRSALYAAGSPVSWPSLLAALTWLVHLLMATEPCEGGTMFDHVGNSLFTNYVNESYHHFLNGEDDKCAELDEEYVAKVKEEVAGHAAEIEWLKEKERELAEILRKLKGEPSPLVALEAQKAVYQEDIEKFNTVVSNFFSHKLSLEKKRDEKTQELETKKEEVANCIKENEDLKVRIAGQPMNVFDIRRMLKEKEILDLDLQSVTNKKEETEKASWDYEINSSKKLRDLEAIVSQFNDSCERLGSTTGEDVQGHAPFEIKLKPSADAPAEILGGTIKTVIKPGVAEIMDRSRKALNEEINPEALSLQDQLFKREIAAGEKLEQIANAVAHNKKLELLCNAREEQKHNTPLLSEARGELEARMAEEKLALEIEEADIEHQLREAQSRVETTVQMCNVEIHQEKAAGTEILEMIMTTKEATQINLRKIDEAASRTIGVFRDLLSSP